MLLDALAKRLIAILILCGSVTRAAEPMRAVDFNREVRPILSKNCFACHGADEQHREGGLRLDRRDGALAPLESGMNAIVPGNSAASELVRRITAKDEAERMPPPGSGRTLTQQQVTTLKQWIDQGAAYAEHWSFVPPQASPLPKLRDASMAINAIDYFVQARLDSAGLVPAAPADRYALIRRLSFDLRGLPPTPQEVAAFVADDRPDAYDRLVDAFLADPAYGERFARMWLDLARYADSRGYGSDPLRPHIWRYRDWVIAAFNRNMPFDQFTIEQLAGDSLTEPTSEQRMATAFHRNTMTNTEGGTDDEEFRVAAVRDRVDTTMQVWMGLTFGCAKCHNHKYDPITQQEYYQLYAFFNQTADADRPDESPTMPAPTAEASARNQQIDAEIARLRQQLEATTPELEKQQQQFELLMRAAVIWTGGWHGGAPSEILAIALMPAERRTKDQQEKLAAHLRSLAPSLKPVRDQIAALEKSRPAVPQLPIMQELASDKRRANFIMVKGSFLNRGETVEPQVPSAFHPFAEQSPVNRLGMAQWLVDRRNPLTARVTVNRFWAQLFGSGLVETEEDFGTQGELPSHPELLDWLAVQFMDDGWDIKRLLKRIVTSAAYRQSAKVTPETLAADPRNRLLSRGPRFRLEAEMVRDQALALAGLLSRKIGGPSVYPPQPEGLWQAAFNGERTWATSTGDDRYRRGLYTFWRRTVPYPSMATFDAPSRETCSIRRIRTNTPLQAFVTMNDPVYVEAAQALARRILREGGASTEERARFALQLCLVRPPLPTEVAELTALVDAEITHFEQDTNSARQLATQPLGELPKELEMSAAAAWTVAANVLLNLDGVLTR